MSKLETQLDQLFVAQISHELNAYLDAMEKTKYVEFVVEENQQDHLFSFRLREGLKCVLRMSRYGNQFLQLKQPWAKCKGSDDDK